MLSKISIRPITLTVMIVLLLINIVLILILAESYFNSSEIKALVDGAEANNLDYELIIHNPLTNSYSFTTVNN